MEVRLGRHLEGFVLLRLRSIGFQEVGAGRFVFVVLGHDWVAGRRLPSVYDPVRRGVRIRHDTAQIPD